MSLVEQLISFITRYNYELDKQPVVRDLEDVETGDTGRLITTPKM